MPPGTPISPKLISSFAAKEASPERCGSARISMKPTYNEISFNDSVDFCNFQGLPAISKKTPQNNGLKGFNKGMTFKGKSAPRLSRNHSGALSLVN